MKKSNNNKNLRHELITLKIYENKNKNLVSKINFLLYKAYDILNNNQNYNSRIKTNQLFSINTKENFNFFESFHHANFRTCKISRIIKVSKKFYFNFLKIF